ncbi:MAG: acyl--CoA ligase [Bacilli bacterium]|nr:acyl--CoA ligase [Bacilli bacterium]
MKIKKINKKLLKNRPWLEFYKDVPATLEYPNISIVDLIKETALKRPEQIAYEYFGYKTNYRDFILKIEAVAKALKSYGVEKNDRVTICMPNTPEGIISFYAVNMIGAIACMVHPLSSEKELEFYLKLSKSKIVITLDVAFEKIYNIKKNTKLEKIIVASAAEEFKIVMSSLYWLKEGRKVNIPYDEVVTSWKTFLKSSHFYKGKYEAHRKASDAAVMLFTGGTTGRPKGVLLSNLNFNALAMQAKMMVLSDYEKTSILAIMPIFHGFGLSVGIHTPLYVGIKCILIPAFSFKDFANLIKKYRPSFLVGVPALFESLMRNKFAKNDLSCIKCIISGGDYMNSELKKKVDAFLSYYGCSASVRQGYGLTESAGATCLTPSDIYKEGTIGIPFPDIEYKIVKIGTHERANVNEDGEICISGPTVMMKYVDNPEETFQVLRTHKDKKVWLHTGDLGSMDEHGFIFFKQRLKRVIISSGYNIYPSHIENVINTHPDVLTTTVIGVAHPYKTQVAKAFIVLKEGIKPTTEIKKEIKRLCEKNISRYALPYEYEFRKALPKTAVGKVAYSVLEEEERNKKIGED